MRTERVVLAILGLALLAVAVGRGRQGASSAELQPHPPRPGAPSPPPFAAKAPAPSVADAQAALHRAFGETVRLEAGAASRCLAGDFNGDGAEDLALPVRPVEGRLAEINDGLANWRVQDALREPASPPGPRPEERAVIGVEAGEALLAVIHGYGSRGWRDEEARQCYLVRNAIGPPLEARPRSELLRYVRRATESPRLEGDVVLSNRGHRAGFIYWTGARYAWHPLPSRAPVPSTAP